MGDTRKEQIWNCNSKNISRRTSPSRSSASRFRRPRRRRALPSSVRRLRPHRRLAAPFLLNELLRRPRERAPTSSASTQCSLPPAEPASHTAPRGPPALLDDDEDKDGFIHELLSLLSIFFDFIPLDHPCGSRTLKCSTRFISTNPVINCHRRRKRQRYRLVAECA